MHLQTNANIVQANLNVLKYVSSSPCLLRDCVTVKYATLCTNAQNVMNDCSSDVSIKCCRCRFCGPGQELNVTHRFMMERLHFKLFSEVLSVLVLTPGFISLNIYYIVKLRFVFI